MGDEDKQDQVMLLAERFKAKLNQTEPSQSIVADGDSPSQVTLEGEGTKFLERVHNCTDRKDVVVRALKELNTGKGLCHEEWWEKDGLVLYRGRVYCQGLSQGTPHRNPPPFVRAELSQYYVINQTGRSTSNSSRLDSDSEMPVWAAV